MKELKPRPASVRSDAPTALSIVLFGRPQLLGDGAPLTFKAPARALSLLCYLLVHAAAPVGRDAVAFALWPDDAEADARANLRRHLFYLSNDVLPPAAPKTPWILADKRTIGWNPAAPAWCDVREFERLAADPENAAEAVALYRGDLLEGAEDEWLAAPRERFRERQIELLLALIGERRAQRAYADGIGFARRLLAVDPWREDAIRALVEFRHAAGDRAGALATYRDFVKRLDAEMGVAPMPETTAAFERVAAATEAAAPGPRGDAPPAADEPRAFWTAPQSISNADAVRPVPSFTGREPELRLIHSALWQRTGRAAIHGLSGIGKSALAREYARRNRDRYAAAWWLNAETEAGIIEGLVRLGAEFVPAVAKLEDRRGAAEHVAANVLSGLSKPVLLIFDNLDEARLLQDWSPHSGAHIVVTARHAVFGGDIIPVRLETWGAADTVAYLRREIGRRDLTDEDSHLLAHTLGFLPLAVAHAAAYLKATVNVTTRRYLERIHDHLGRTPRGADYDRAVYATFREAIARAEEDAPGAAALLCLAACFAPDAIPEELFHQPAARYARVAPRMPAAAALDLHNAVADTIGMEDALGALHRFSLLTFSHETRTYTLHRLVQKAARLLLVGAEPAWAASAVSAAQAAFSAHDFAHWPACERLVLHARAALDALPAGSADPCAARLALACGEYLRKRAAFADAEALLRQGLAFAEAAAADGADADIAQHTEALAAVLRDTNRPAEAEPLLRRAVELYEARAIPDDPRLAAALNDLAILLHYANRLDEAEALYRRALAIDEGAFGPDHPVVALRLHNLALVLHETNRLAEAEPLLERALRIDERAFGGDHPDVASDLGNLGWLIFETGRIAAAEPLLRRTVAIREAAYGAAHPGFAHALSDLAVLLHDTERFGEAERFYRQALEIYEASYGAAHPVVAACLNNVAELLADAGRFAEADALYGRALASDEATYGPHHTNVARDLNNHAGLLVAVGRAAEAAPLVRRALAIVRESYGADHPRVQIVSGNAALLERGGPESAARWRNIRRSPSRGLR